MRTTGNLLSASYGAEPVKDYDFRRPDKFTYRGVLKAQDLHLEFLRTLQARLPETAKFSIACIDQMTYGEWKASLAPADRAFATFDTAPSRPREEVIIPMPATLVARAEAPKLEMLDPETIEALRGYALSQSRPTGRRPVLASIEGGARALLGEDPGLAVTAACLRNGWKRVADLRMGSASIASAAPGEESIAEGEMILLVSLRHSGGGTLDLVYPALTLEPCFSALNA
jgi:flagellar motor switch protein FliM